MTCIAHFQKKQRLHISLLKAELNLESNKKRILKTNRRLKVCNKINIYRMKHWNNSCQKKV